MLDRYEINSSTLAILPISEDISQVIEENESYTINRSTLDIIDDSCKFFGSSYIGREVGSKALIGNNYKAPILVEESRMMIFIPTSSPRFSLCSWLSMKQIIKYEKRKNKTQVYFKNGTNLLVDISIFSLENQMLRAIRLENALKNRISS